MSLDLECDCHCVAVSLIACFDGAIEIYIPSIYSYCDYQNCTENLASGILHRSEKKHKNQ